PAQTSATTTTKPHFTISQETTAITTPLRSDGTVDYVAAINEKYSAGVTPKNNGFVAWLKVFGTSDEVLASKTKSDLLKACGAEELPADAPVWVPYQKYLEAERGLTGDALINAAEELMKARQTLWTRQEKPELASFLRAREKQLAAAAEAAELPKWWVPAVTFEKPAILTINLPSLGRWREVTYAFAARATLRAHDGDFEGFWKDVRTTKLLAAQMGQGATLIERLVGVAMDGIANQACGTVAGAGILTEPQCKSLAERLAAMPLLPALPDSVETLEQWNTLDIIATISMGKTESYATALGQNTSDDPNLSKLQTIDTQEVDWDLVLKLATTTYNEEVLALGESGFRDMLEASRAVESRLMKWTQDLTTHKDLRKDPTETRDSYSKRAAQSLACTLVLTTGAWKAEVLKRRAGQQRQMLSVLLAAAQSKAAHGKWPASQEELVPGLLKELPIDMYSKDGKSPFRYLARDGTATVYSVGENGEDDGGIWIDAGKKDDLPIGAIR
ncbi:MAG TPA: hypothetical protein VHM90_06120, partial [Phycisphaerae bacterium]|nr:hypothetical protein [Phycisphaerae bacterium]